MGRGRGCEARCPVTYRTPDPAAELAALRAEVAALRAKPATRWSLNEAGRSEGGSGLVLVTLGAWCCEAIAFVFYGACPPVLRGAVVCAVASLLWALAFVRRVPAEGSAR